MISLLNFCIRFDKQFVKAKALVDKPPKDGSTPRLTATCKGHIEVVMFLINSNANVVHPMKCGTTALMLAMKENLKIVAIEPP